MLFSRKLIIKTLDSQDKVVEKMRQLMDPENCRIYKHFYKGEVTKEKFYFKPQRAEVPTSPLVWIGGKFVETQHGTNIESTIDIYTSKKVSRVALTVLLVLLFLRELSNSTGRWQMIVIVSVLVLSWFFFFLEFWTEVRNFKLAMRSLFTESKKENDATT
jgi:hypothetical protein